MKMFCWIFAILVSMTLVSGIVSAHSVEGQIIIHITDEGFDPSTIEIEQGQTVIFENEGEEDHWPASDVHPTHEIYSEFDPGRPVSPGETWKFTFEKAGAFTLHDHLYPQFTGTIAVVKDEIGGDTIAQKTASSERKNYISLLFERIKTFFVKILSKSSADKQGIEEKSILKTNVVKELRTQFALPSDYDLTLVYQETDFNCESSNFFCFSKILKNITKKYGPKVALNILEKLLSDEIVSTSIDEHQLAHEIGRQTAISFGLNAEAFLFCPMSSFNGGCQHGFFEYVLGKTDTATEAADLICKSLNDSFSSKFKFYCYHGIGHGVMMARAYDLDAALETCDSFLSYYASDGCWQGVFMENVNVGMVGEAREGVFSDTDPLAPCNVVEDKYRHECFINHAGYLMVFFENDIGKASAACLNAPLKRVSSCLQGLGLLTTNPSWQYAITRKDSNGSVETALKLCEKFPSQAKKDCFIGALDNIINYDEMDLSKRALRFCKQVKGLPEEDCYRQIGINIARQVVDLQQRYKLCGETPVSHISNCLEGAGK